MKTLSHIDYYLIYTLNIFPTEYTDFDDLLAVAAENFPPEMPDPVCDSGAVGSTTTSAPNAVSNYDTRRSPSVMSNCSDDYSDSGSESNTSGYFDRDSLERDQITPLSQLPQRSRSLSLDDARLYATRQSSVTFDIDCSRQRHDYPQHSSGSHPSLYRLTEPSLSSSEDSEDEEYDDDEYTPFLEEKKTTAASPQRPQKYQTWSKGSNPRAARQRTTRQIPERTQSPPKKTQRSAKVARQPLKQAHQPPKATRRPPKQECQSKPPRNQQFRVAGVDRHLQNVEDLDFACPYCAWKQKNRRMPDFLRHIRTHRRSNDYVCKGVLAREAVKYSIPSSAETYLLSGELRIGGCRKTFSRADALTRHFKNKNNHCVCEA